jgi:hypothetical protein
MAIFLVNYDAAAEAKLMATIFMSSLRSLSLDKAARRHQGLK